MTLIIETGGKQYCVEPGQKLTVERLNAAVGDTLTFSNLLGSNQVQAEVVAHSLGDKVTSRKFRNKTRYIRVKGHRQSLTVLLINETDNAGEAKTEKPASRAKPRAKKIEKEAV
jgi:large subunit ribosomal protein L21